MLTSCFFPALSPVSAVAAPSKYSVPSSTHASFSRASSPPGESSLHTLPRFFRFESSG